MLQVLKLFIDAPCWNTCRTCFGPVLHWKKQIVFIDVICCSEICKYCSALTAHSRMIAFELLSLISGLVPLLFSPANTVSKLYFDWSDYRTVFHFGWAHIGWTGSCYCFLFAFRGLTFICVGWRRKNVVQSSSKSLDRKYSFSGERSCQGGVWCIL